MIEIKVLKTTDLNLIIFLASQGHSIIDSKLDSNKSIVMFKNSTKLQSDILKFVNGEEEINITDYQAVEKRVKTLIYQNKNK